MNKEWTRHMALLDKVCWAPQLQYLKACCPHHLTSQTGATPNQVTNLVRSKKTAPYATNHNILHIDLRVPTDRYK